MALVFSFDVERNLLQGKTLAIAVTVRRDGVEIDQFLGRLPDDAFTEEWVIEHILPACRSIPVTHQTSVDLEEDYWDLWMKYKGKEGLQVVVNCGQPVETRLILDCIDRNRVERYWAAPHPMHELATAFLLRGVNTDSSVEYLRQAGIPIPASISELDAHHPRYDAVVAALCWEHLSQE